MIKRIRNFQIIIGILILSATSALAGSVADMKFIGFSEDGKYLAFEEIESSYEAGEYELDVTYIVDTAKNSFAIAPIVYEWDGSKSAKLKAGFLARYKRSVAANLKRFKIKPGNTGHLVVSHLLYDWTFIKPVESEQRFTHRDGFETTKRMPDYQGAYVPKEGGLNEKIIFNPSPSDFVVNTSEFYELTLLTLPAKCSDCDSQYKIELTLQDNSQHKDKPVQILQKDADTLPEARRSAFAYKVETVYVYSDKIAVFLNVFSPGFEGPAINYMVVTGEIK